METTIEQDMEGLNKPKEPVSYAYKYGQLRGLLLTLKYYDNAHATASMLRERVNAVFKRMEEIDRE